MSSNDPTGLAALLTACEQTRAAHLAALDALHAAASANPAYAALANSVAYVVGEARGSNHLADLRWTLAEIERVKGPMVTVTVRGHHHNEDRTYRVELASVTGGAIVLRNGERYSRRTGQRTSAAFTAWGVTYSLTRAEIDRVVALGWRAPKGTR